MAGILISEIGVVSRHHINEENKDKSKNATMHGDTTTKKGQHF